MIYSQEIFEGVISGGRHCSRYRRRFRYEGLTSKQFNLFKSDKETPNPEEYDEQIEALSGLVTAFAAKLMTSVVNATDRNLNATHCATLESLRKLKLDRKEQQDAMIEAGDVGIAYLRAHGGEVIGLLIDKLRTKSKDSMDLLRKVDTYIGKHFGGNAETVRDEIERELLLIPAAKSKVELSEVFTQLQSLNEEIELHIKENPDALAQGKIGPAHTPFEQISWLRRRVSNLADELKDMRSFIDKKRTIPLTLEKVETQVTWMCQQNVTTVDQEETTSGAKVEGTVRALKAAAPTMDEAMAMVTNNGGTISFPANAALEQPRFAEHFGGRGGGRGGGMNSWGGDHGHTTFERHGGGRGGGGGGRGGFTGQLGGAAAEQDGVFGVCRMWQTGNCTFGDICKYVHNGGDGRDVRWANRKRERDD